MAQSQGWQDWGKRAAKATDDPLAEHPEFVSLVEKLGAEISSGDSDAASAWQNPLPNSWDKKGSRKTEGPQAGGGS